MKNVDDLILKARQLSAESKGSLIVGFINPKGTRWSLSCMIEGSGGIKMIESQHDTIEQAQKEAQRVAEEYPNSEDVTIIVNDVPRGNP